MTTESKLTAAGLGAIYGVLDNLGPAPHHAKLVAEDRTQQAKAMRDAAAGDYMMQADQAYLYYRNTMETVRGIFASKIAAADAIEKGE